MIELRTKTTIQRLPSIIRFGESFTAPVVFFLQNDAFDERGIFPTCAIADFQKGEIRYVHSLLSENLALLDSLDPEKKRFSLRKAGNDPHGALRVSDVRFLVSFSYARFFLDFDLKSETVTIREDADLFPTPLENVLFGSTFFKTPWKLWQGKEYFYLTRGGKLPGSDGFALECHAVASDLSESRLVHKKISSHLPYPPHVSREFEGLLFQSHFFQAEFRISSTGEKYADRVDFLKKAYSDLEKLYRSTELGKKDSVPKSYSIELENSKIQFFGSFERFIELLYQKTGAIDLFDLTDQLFGYGVELVSGEFNTLNLNTGEEASYPASTARTAHIEFDDRRKRAYVSSHNFDTTPHGKAIAYFWPAKVDRFDFSGTDKLVKVGTFSDPRGFRFTSHRAFEYRNKAMLCTIWHPGRLFFIDAETMELDYFFDIVPNRLGELSWKPLLDYVKSVNPGRNDGFLRALEVSTDGRYVFIPGRDEYFIFDQTGKTVCEIIPKSHDAVTGDVNLNDFKQVCSHCQYLA